MDPNENLREKLVGISHETLDHAQAKKRELEEHHFIHDLRQVLQDMKNRIALNPRINHEDEPQDPQLMRLDNMLVAEGVATQDSRGNPISSAAAAAAANAAGLGGQLSPSEGIIENQEYKNKLLDITEVYNAELTKYHCVSPPLAALTSTLAPFHVHISYDCQQVQLLTISSTSLSPGTQTVLRTVHFACGEPPTRAQQNQTNHPARNGAHGQDHPQKVQPNSGTTQAEHM